MLFIDDEAFSVSLKSPAAAPGGSDTGALITHLLFCLLSFRQMDPVQKAVINHTFGMPLIKTKRPVISCNVCQIRFNSEVQNACAVPSGSFHIVHISFFLFLKRGGGLHPMF